MFVLTVGNLTELKALTPSSLFDGMPISVLVNGVRELYIWWEGVTWADDGHLIIQLDTPNDNLGAFKKVFNKFIASPSVPITDPTADEVGIYWLDTSLLAVYVAASFIIDEVRQYKWIQLVNGAGGK